MDHPLKQLPPRNLSTRRIYAYYLNISGRRGWIKVGETERDIRVRIGEQLRTSGLLHDAVIVMDEPAVTADGRAFRDVDVHKVLLQIPGVTQRTDVSGDEWFECSESQAKSAYLTVFRGEKFTRIRDKSFGLREEQILAVNSADAYFNKCLAEDKEPRFLWNAKMRFGKTFASYHLAKQRDAKRVLVVSFKPAVRDSWQSDLESHADFEGWEFFSRNSNNNPTEIGLETPLVCFSSLQDLRGRTEHDSIKEHNKWIHDVVWDLVIVDEYHYGAWNDATKELLSGEVGGGDADFADALGEDNLEEVTKDLVERLDNIKGKAFLCLSGTPFRAIASNEFTEEQIFNWTYTDEQRAKEEYAEQYPGDRNPYASLPSMNLLIYMLPEKIRQVAVSGKRNEFDLNSFFDAKGSGGNASFTFKDQVQAWLDWLRGQDFDSALEAMGTDLAKPFPYSDPNILPYMNHSVWFLPRVASVFAMRNLMNEPQNVAYWSRQFIVLPIAGTSAGTGEAALGPVRKAIGSGFDSKTITLTCGKLLTGVTVPQWSSILILNNLEAPESYFQAAFRVQSPWSVWNEDGLNPNEERVLKSACLVLDFAPTRALRLYADYGMRLGVGKDADNDIRELAKYLPVLGFRETQLREVSVDEIVDVAYQTTSVDTRRMDSKRFINADTSKLKQLSQDAQNALARVTTLRRSNSESDQADTVINETPELKEPDNSSSPLSKKVDPEGNASEEELAERLSFLATRINAFMYLSDDIEKNLTDVLTTEEELLFRAVMQLSQQDMLALVEVGLFNEQAMRLAIHQFRRSDVASFNYTGLHPRAEENGGAKNAD